MTSSVDDKQSNTFPALNEKTTFHDPAFAVNKSLPIHRWVPWIAGFSGGFVREALNKYLDGPGIVLDPFAGVGTTLVEATLSGHQAIGFEINPYAALACRLKLNAYHINVGHVRKEVQRFQWFYSKAVEEQVNPHSVPPEGFKTRAPFYSPAVLHKVLLVRDFTQTIRDDSVRSLFDLIFAATMVSYSNYSYEPSLGRRASADKPDIEDFPVEQAILSKLLQIIADVEWLQEHTSQSSTQFQVINDTWFNYQQYTKPAQVDIIITSPPYLNNYHYNRNTRPHLYWLGYAQNPQDFKALEHGNFGTFWQTVRERERLDLSFTLPGSDMADRLEHLRNLNPERGIYGGKGWANYAAAYFNDCYRFAKSMYEVLKPGGRALVVLGNSILQGVVIPTDRYLGQIAEAVGLELVHIDIPRSKRIGNSIIQSDVRVGKAQKSQQLYEAVVELRK